MLEPVIFLLGIVFGFIVWDNVIDHAKYCNRNYNYGKASQELQLKKPQYEVKKVERVWCKNDGSACAKYTLQNWHIKKKDDIEMQELYLYDEVGKYNIGDILVLERK